MPDTQVKVEPSSLRRKIIWRVVSIFAAATIFSFITTSIAKQSEKSADPAGFARGVLHGALMPCAMPNLLVGHDVIIYATVNTGRTYKLGYTTGVNGCGALFFGFFFWRINRWRKRFGTKA